LRFVPGSSRLAVLDKAGTLHVYELQGSSAHLLGAAALPNVDPNDDCGAISLAFDPGFSNNRLFYVGHCVSPTHSRVTRFTWDENLSAVPASAATIIEVGDAAASFPWHNVGSIGFDDATTMWALFGEKTLPDSAQNLATPLGKLLRLIPSRDPLVGGFEAAPDNPYPGDTAAARSVYALGLRSPWKGTRDSLGRYWVGDVGQDLIEELNLVRAPGQNFGWPSAEGLCSGICDGLTNPLIAYGRNPAERYNFEDPQSRETGLRSIWVAGPFPAASNDPYRCNLDGLILFGDFFKGWVRVAQADVNGTLTLDRPVGHLEGVAAFTRADDGTLFAVTFGDYKGTNPGVVGALYRVSEAAR
jgi:hypothetical protein